MIARPLLAAALMLAGFAFPSAAGPAGAQPENAAERDRQERIAQVEARRQDGPVVDPDEARRLARDAVDVPEDVEPPDLPEINAGAPGAGLIANLVVLLVFGAIVAAVVFVIVRIARRRAPADDEAEEPPEPESAVVGEIADAADGDADWARLAAQAAERGDFADAVRYLHLAGVVRLDDRGHIVFDASKTNGDYVRALTSRDPEAAQHLLRLSRTMEATTFGSEPADRTTFETADSDWTELHGRLGAGNQRVER